MTRGSVDRQLILGSLSEDIGRRLSLYADLLVRWQPTINLVAPSTLPDLWTRHISDSMQVQAAVPDARRWVDLGSGGGFPGLVTAIVLADQPMARVHLVESDKRKSAFLRTVVRETGAPAVVHVERIQRFTASFREPVDAISARALAPLPQLLVLAQKLLDSGATGVFPKGETVDIELTALPSDRRFRIEAVPSRIRNGSSLLIVRTAEDSLKPGVSEAR